MRPYMIRTDLSRVVLGGFSLPLGLEPENVPAPIEGYMVRFVASEEPESPASSSHDDEHEEEPPEPWPDSYRFEVAVSHEKLAPLLHRLFRLLPDDVFVTIEIGSRDAYRSTDVFSSVESLTRVGFRRVWDRYEEFLLEDCSMGLAVAGEDPAIEVFVDPWKGVVVHVPVELRDRAEEVLHEAGLSEQAKIWPDLTDDEYEQRMRLRSVLAVNDEYSPDLDELLLQVREELNLDLDVDPAVNVDDAGRALGYTLWQGLLILESTQDPYQGCYASIWATASSMNEFYEVAEEALSHHPEWRYTQTYTLDRVAFDERPDSMASLPARRRRAELHSLQFDAWQAGDGR